MTILAAKAGKDIYCEKPTAITIRESQAMQEAVLRYGRVFQAGTQQRSEYGGKFRRACELVRNGAIGDLKEIYGCRTGGIVRMETVWAAKAHSRGAQLGSGAWAGALAALRRRRSRAHVLRHWRH